MNTQDFAGLNGPEITDDMLDWFASFVTGRAQAQLGMEGASDAFRLMLRRSLDELAAMGVELTPGAVRQHLRTLLDRDGADQFGHELGRACGALHALNFRLGLQ